jgi:hypothetical protein
LPASQGEKFRAGFTVLDDVFRANIDLLATTGFAAFLSLVRAASQAQALIH